MSHVILIAEDEELVRILVVEYLKDVGFKVIEAANAAHALAVINEAGPIDLVFTDIQMPGELDGQGLAHWLQQHRPDVPVLLAEVERHIRELLH